MFCSATGYGGTTQTATRAPDARAPRKFEVRFDTNVAPGLDWRFEPETPTVQIRPGETTTVFFRVKNLSDKPTRRRRASTSSRTGRRLVRQDACFCFTEQKLAPHEEAEWPVVFFLDPKLDQARPWTAIDAITLSYTFFAPPKAAKLEPATAAGKNRDRKSERAG